MLTNNPQVAKAREALLKAITDINSQFKSDGRLRLGVWTILFIVLLQPIWLLQDAHVQLENDLQKLLLQESKVLRTTNEDFWQQRAENAQLDLKQLQAKIPSTSSLGIAKATIHSFLAKKINELEVNNAKLEVQDPVASRAAPHVYRVAARIDFPLDETKIYALLAALEQSSQALVVEQLEISQLRAGKAVLLVVGHFRYLPEAASNAP